MSIYEIKVGDIVIFTSPKKMKFRHNAQHGNIYKLIDIIESEHCIMGVIYTSNNLNGIASTYPINWFLHVDEYEKHLIDLNILLSSKRIGE